MKFTSDFGSFDIADVSSDEDNWVTIQSQSVSYDKTDYFIERFNEEFAGFNLLGSTNQEKFTFLSELCARTPAMREWFAATSVGYSDTTQLPLYLKDRVAPDKFKAIQDKFLVLKDKLAEVINERNELARKYTRDLESLKLKEQDITRKDRKSVV